MATRATRGGGGKRRGSARARSSSGGLWPLLTALAVVIGGISLYDHRKELPDWLDRSLDNAGRMMSRMEAGRSDSGGPASTSGPRPPAAIPVPQSPAGRPAVTAAPLPPATTLTPRTAMMPRGRDEPLPPATMMVAAVAPGAVLTPGLTREKASGRFAYCGTSGLDNCVIDGDTFVLRKEKIRIADIDTPETVEARCPSERERGFAAKVRLRELLNAGGFELASFGTRDEDQFGRKLRVVTRNGRSLGALLVDEGLARPWSVKRQPWC